MSSIEYRNLLTTIGRSLEECNITDLLYLCKGKIQDGNEQNISDIRTLFKEMEANNTLGIDRLENLKEILRVLEKWRLFKEAGKFQMKRKKYNDLLQQISEALDENIAMEQLILICRRKVLEEIEGNINDTRSLLRKLETQNNLEFSRLDILKEVLNSVEKEDLLSKVEEFERWRNDGDESACRGGIFLRPYNLFVDLLICLICKKKVFFFFFFWGGGGARRLTYGCKFRILVSLRVFWAKRHHM